MHKQDKYLTGGKSASPNMARPFGFDCKKKNSSGVQGEAVAPVNKFPPGISVIQAFFQNKFLLHGLIYSCRIKPTL